MLVIERPAGDRPTEDTDIVRLIETRSIREVQKVVRLPCTSRNVMIATLLAMKDRRRRYRTSHVRQAQLSNRPGRAIYLLMQIALLISGRQTEHVMRARTGQSSGRNKRKLHLSATCRSARC
jgi:hypothetical protein